MGYIDENDYQAQLDSNRTFFRNFKEKIKKDIREKGVSHCGQFTTEKQVDEAFKKPIETGEFCGSEPGDEY